ncbi:hypothetical protein [Allosphingosinicella vermicomposti]|uniref:hypothetical protein n=1 Tax=Allosphingosinicella vermicomposti TaxID=614671 RepID=UPI001FE0EC0F|nr:hypothetical protein [Allosphingosinicella vermicomposti]
MVRITGRRWMIVTRILKHCLFVVAAIIVAAPAAAEVKITFHSREFGATFPHAFVSLKGRLDATGEVIDTGYGFTAKTISPAILMGSVGGQLQVETRSYIENSQRHFTITVDDEGYRTLMAVVDKWRNAKQPSYNLNRANCVHFVGEMAQAAGLNVTFDPKLMKKPRSFLVSVKAANEARVEPALGLDGTQAAAP